MAQNTKVKKPTKLWKELLLRFSLAIVGGFIGFNLGCYLGSLFGMNSTDALIIIGSVFYVIFTYVFGFKIAGIFLGEE